MGWLAPALAVGGLLMGRSSAKQADRQREADQRANEIEARYSNWLAPNYRPVGAGGNVLGSALGGATYGMMMGAQLDKEFPNMFSKGTGMDTTGKATDKLPVNPKSMIGAPDYSSALAAELNPGIAEMNQKIATPAGGWVDPYLKYINSPEHKVLEGVPLPLDDVMTPEHKFLEGVPLPPDRPAYVPGASPSAWQNPWAKYSLGRTRR